MKTKLVLFSFSLFLLCGCTQSAEPSSEETEAVRDIFAMDTYMYLKAYGDSADTALGIAAERILSLEEVFSVTSENSDTWAVNHAEGEPVAVSEDTLTLLYTAQEIGTKTDGALDVTLYPVLSAWGFTTETQQIPDPETLAAALELVDFRSIALSGDMVQLPAGMQLDFGALAKGYTSDCVTEILRENGVGSALVNLGGNVHAVGAKPDGSAWRVGVQDPFSPSEQVCILEIENEAVITSGNYERYFTGEDGKNYWHILDPADGYPADNGLVSVTIVGESGLLCDALSTALFVLGTEGAADYWQNEGGFEMILVTEDAKLYYTEGLADSIQLTGTMGAEVITRDKTS